MNESRHTFYRLAVLVIGLFTGFFSFEPFAQAATITVDNGTSTVAVDSSCSIREAIQNANDNAATNADCTAGSGTDTLDIQTDIVLTTVDHQEDGATVNFATPQVTESIIIDGNNFTISRSGANDMQFILLTGGDISLSMNDVTISSFSLNTGFDRDGAIDLHDAGAGTLTLTNVTFDGNLGGAIHSGMGGGTGDWIITNSTFTNNVVGGGNGGIINSAPVRNFTLSNSTFTNNESTSGVDGAAITFLDGAGPGGPFTISISDSIFTGNIASSFGGVLGISSFFPTIVLEISDSTFDGNIAGNGGGALSIEGGTFTDIDATITGSTFKDNDSGGSGGAIYVQDGVDLVMTNNTFSGNSSLNGGGIAFNPQGVGDNSIQGSFNTFTNNTASSGSGTDIYQVDPTTKSSVLENNIFNSGGDECGGTFTNYTFTNNLSNDTTCGANGAVTSLASIADNGGSVWTAALLAVSNAINNAIAGTLGCPATDARGIGRPSGAGCDIGAYEFVNSTPTDIALTDSLVDEHESVGEVVADITTTDANPGDVFTYSLACTVPGVDDASFSISSNQLLSAEVFDYSNTSTYAICIRTTDNAGATYDENFTISVEEHVSASGSSGGGGPSTPAPAPSPVEPIPVPPTPPVIPPLTPDVLPPPLEEPVAPPESPISPDPSVTPTDNQPVESPRPTTNPVERFENFPEALGYVLGNAIEEIPEGTAETVTIVGVTLPAVAFIVTQPAMAANLATLPIRLWNLIPIWLGLRRRKRPWGTVYDSVTKQPLDPVYVSLRNLSGREVATTITDLDGRFGFLVAPGRYKISARKDNYEFPSKKLAGKETDDLYGSLYDGQEIDIAGEESLVIKNVPMDSTSFNWNEFEKAKNKKLMKFYSKRDVLIARVAEIAFWAGLVCSLIILYLGPSELNYVLSGVYVAVLVLRFFGVKPKRPGYIVEAGTGFPLSFGLLKVYSARLQKEVAHAVIGKTGKYYVLVPNGEYYVKIEKKIGEDTYQEVRVSDPFMVKKGFIGKNFKV